MIDPASLRDGQKIYTVRTVWGVEVIDAVVKRRTKTTVWLEPNKAYATRLVPADFASWHVTEREAKEVAIQLVRRIIEKSREEVAKYQSQESELAKWLEVA